MALVNTNRCDKGSSSCLKEQAEPLTMDAYCSPLMTLTRHELMMLDQDDDFELEPAHSQASRSKTARQKSHPLHRPIASSSPHLLFIFSSQEMGDDAWHSLPNTSLGGHMYSSAEDEESIDLGTFIRPFLGARDGVGCEVLPEHMAFLEKSCLTDDMKRSHKRWQSSLRASLAGTDAA